jgi:hypothetical protein
MDLHDGCLEKALVAAGFVIDENGVEAALGDLRRYLCLNCGLWWKTPPTVEPPLCRQCGSKRGWPKENPKSYPPLF